MTANASSSSDRNQAESSNLHLDLLATSRLPALPTAFLQDRDRDLLAPLSYLAADRMPFDSAIRPQTDRTELARALRTANAAYGHPAADLLADRLADPATRVVVTGQQPGLYGGPLYALSKMVAAVLWAEAMTAAGEPTVAVFWVATEDHDWTEIAQANFLDRSGIRNVELGQDPAPLMPVGMRTLGPGLTAVEQQLGDISLPSWYRPDARFGEAFCRLMVATLGERAPLMLDSMLPAVKQLQRPWLRKLVDRRHEVGATQDARNGEIEGRGYSLQVKPQPGVSPLFLLHGQQRRRIAWGDGETFILRGVDEPPRSIDQLYEILRDNPSVVSPGVLARPAIQDALLGTTLQIMGPAELSYMPQVAPIYSIFEIDAPWTTLRPQALVMEERHAGYLEELGISLAELVEHPVEHLVADRFGEDPIGPVREQVETLLESLREPLMTLDRSLEGPLRKTLGHFGRGFDQLNGKVTGAVARRHDVWTRRLQLVRDACMPEGRLQERVLSVAHFLTRYGPDFAEFLCRDLALDPSLLHVVRMNEAHRGSSN